MMTSLLLQVQMCVTVSSRTCDMTLGAVNLGHY